MKTRIPLIVVSALIGLANHLEAAAQSGRGSLADRLQEWSITHRDEVSTRYELTNGVSVTDDSATLPVRRITHVGSGLNYMDENGNFQ
jgi:hypothetical protein